MSPGRAHLSTSHEASPPASPEAEKTPGTASAYAGTRHRRPRAGRLGSAYRSTTSGGQDSSCQGAPDGTPTRRRRCSAWCRGGRSLPGIGRGQPGQEPAQRPVGWRPARGPSGQELDGDDPGGVEILPRVGWCAGGLLGCQVTGGTDATSARHSRFAGAGGDAEVGQPDPRTARTGRLEQEVAGLDVAVHDSGRVHGGQGVERLLEEHPDIAVGERTVAGEQLLDVATAHEVHHQTTRHRVERTDDMAMTHPHGLLTHEAGQGRGVVPGDQLGGDPPPLGTVPRPPDGAHAARADLVGQDIPLAHHPGRYARDGPARAYEPAACGLGGPQRPLIASAGCPDPPHCGAETGPTRTALLPRRDRGRRVQRRWVACVPMS